MGVDIEAYQITKGGILASCWGYLRYLHPEYRHLNKELLNLTYNIRGSAKDLPALLGLEACSQPEGIVKINWDEALDNIIDLLVHRDMIGDEELHRNIAVIANFVVRAYQMNLCTPDADPIVIKWSA
jgi:hypothetical protein